MTSSETSSRTTVRRSFDECHHVSAFSFERVMKEAKARFVLGLTADSLPGLEYACNDSSTPCRDPAQHWILSPVLMPSNRYSAYWGSRTSEMLSSCETSDRRSPK